MIPRFTRVANAMKVTMRRVAGSFRFTCGQVGGSASPRLRRRSRHSPTGISSNPRTNSAGTSTKMMMPTYGFVQKSEQFERDEEQEQQRTCRRQRHPDPRDAVAQGGSQNGSHEQARLLLLQATHVGDERVESSTEHREECRIHGVSLPPFSPNERAGIPAPVSRPPVS